MPTVKVERLIAARPEAVFDAWLDPDQAGRWLFATEGGAMEKVEIDARVGGGFAIWERRGDELAEHYGEYVALDPPNHLAFDFWTSFSEERTRITIEIEPEGDGARLTLTHEGVWADYEERTRHGWGMVLDNLSNQVEA